MIFSFLNPDVFYLIIFVISFSIFLIFKRKNIDNQKVLFPIIYVLLYRTNFGIKFMQKVVKKYRNLVKFIGYNCIGFAFVGMIFISISVVWAIISYLIIPSVSTTGMSLVLPGTNIPGVGYLSFWYWLISLFLLALVHEFSHGIVALAHNVKIKSSGFGILAIIAPIIPAAFVEPDENVLQKKNDFVQYSVFAAGPISNLFVAIVLLLIFPFVLNTNVLGPFEDKFSTPVGISFDLTNSTLPAAEAGLKNGTIITGINSLNITKYNDAAKGLYCTEEGVPLLLSNENETFYVTPIKDNKTNGTLIGITNVKNERRIKEGYEKSGAVYYWIKGLFRWLFLLNFFVAFVNLLPIFVTDGARMLYIFINEILQDEKKVKKIWGYVNYGFLLLLLLGIIVPFVARFI